MFRTHAESRQRRVADDRARWKAHPSITGNYSCLETSVLDVSARIAADGDQWRGPGARRCRCAETMQPAETVKSVRHAAGNGQDDRRRADRLSRGLAGKGHERAHHHGAGRENRLAYPRRAGVRLCAGRRAHGRLRGQGVQHVYRTGDALLEAINVRHNGQNTGSGPLRLLVVFMGADGAQMTVPSSQQKR